MKRELPKVIYLPTLDPMLWKLDVLLNMQTTHAGRKPEGKRRRVSKHKPAKPSQNASLQTEIWHSA